MIDLLSEKISISYAFSIDPCKKSNEDVTVFRGRRKTTYNFLRQPQRKASTKNLCLSDFLHDEDWLGTFAIWVDGIDERADTLRLANDDYRSIMIQALGDRFAEATAEWFTNRFEPSTGDIARMKIIWITMTLYQNLTSE